MCTEVHLHRLRDTVGKNGFFSKPKEIHVVFAQVQIGIAREPINETSKVFLAICRCVGIFQQKGSALTRELKQIASKENGLQALHGQKDSRE